MIWFIGFVLVLVLWMRGENTRRNLESLENQFERLQSEMLRLRSALAEVLAAHSKPSESKGVATPTVETLAEPVPEPPPVFFHSALPAPPPLPSLLGRQPVYSEPELDSPTEPEFQIPTPPPESPAFNWERFLGVKLFAWLGGLALVLGVAFFVKYSFENNLISPQARIALGYLLGIGLIGAALWIPRERHLVTVQTLCATGTLILYVDTFAAHAYYKLLPSMPTFALMSLITATAFLLAIRLEAQVVAILGLLGGFLTPPMLSTGVDNPGGLFGYIALLDLGMIAVVLRKRWTYLMMLAAIATCVMQAGWVGKFFEPEKFHTALSIFLVFAGLFFGAWLLARRIIELDKWISSSAVLMPSAAFAFALFTLAHPYGEIGRQPLSLFIYVLGADLIFLGLASMELELRPIALVSGFAAFLLLTVWTAQFMSVDLLYPGLGAFFVFGLLHAAYPIILQRLKPAATGLRYANLFPILTLALLFVPLLRLGANSFVIWAFLLLIDLLAICLAFLTVSVMGVIAAFLLTIVAAAMWITRAAVEVAIGPAVGVIGVFAIVFILAGIVIARKLLPRLVATSNGVFNESLDPNSFGNLAAAGAALPFVLLDMVVWQMRPGNPSTVFGMAMLLVVLFMGVSILSSVDLLAVTALASVLVLEHIWHFALFTPAHVWLAAAWYLAFSAVFMVVPFLARDRLQFRIVPWLISALALPLHFLLLYRGFGDAFSAFPYKGLVPAVLALPCFIALGTWIKKPATDERMQQSILALFGGAALLFITLIFPIQFHRQWLTAAWALEGVALIWLFQRVPHRGLPAVGFALLATAFARLALNPWIILQYQRTGTPILNWYLYIYGLAAVCCFVAARLLAPPRDQVAGLNAPPILYSGGTIIAFLLLNIEIADYFSGPGTRLTFNFSASLAQDMTYSLAWAVFASILLAVGFKLRNGPARYAGITLLVVTIVKLFLHDLWRLGGLYRIGSLVGLAVVLMLVSFIYQRFLSSGATTNPTITPEPNES